MSPVESLFADYADHHRTRGNRACHFAGVPLLLVSALGLLARVPVGRAGGVPIDLALVLLGLVGVYAVVLEWRLGSLLLAASLALYVCGRPLPVAVLASLHVLGWLFQIAGHAWFEGRSPAFTRNLTHLLIGPLWLVNEVVGFVEVADDPLPRGETGEAPHAKRRMTLPGADR